MSNGVDFRKLALDLRAQLTTAQSELTRKDEAYQGAHMMCQDLKSELAALREELATAKRAGPPHFCGLPMSLNPHPEAGLPGRFLEVGAVSECIPCLVSSRHGWAKTAGDLQQRLTAAEQEADQFRESSAQIASDLLAAEQRNAELDLEWSRTITDRGLIALELNKAKQLLRDVLDEVPHGWGESFSESDLADRIRQAIPMRFCDACEQYVEGPCSSWDCSTPEVENWTKPTESGASDKCASDGGTCGLGGHCGECPHIESGASE